MELLYLAMGFHLSQKELEACFRDLGVDFASGTIPFELFFDWWTDSMGMDAIRKRAASPSRSSGHK